MCSPCRYIENEPVYSNFFKWTSRIPLVGLIIEIWKRQILKRDFSDRIFLLERGQLPRDIYEMCYSNLTAAINQMKQLNQNAEQWSRIVKVALIALAFFYLEPPFFIIGVAFFATACLWEMAHATIDYCNRSLYGTLLKYPHA